MSRDMDEKPYSPDEARVAEFLSGRGAGGGDDPIGFMLASYALIMDDRKMLLQKFHDAVAVLRRAT